MARSFLHVAALMACLHPALPAGAQTLLWEASLNAYLPLGVSARSRDAVATDTLGNVFVAVSDQSNCRIVSYRPDGVLRWTKQTASDRGGCVVAVDGAGDVLVGANAPTGIKAAKYAGSSGLQVWESETVDAAFSGTVGPAAVDPAGNLVLGGVRVIKFLGSTGAVAWNVSSAASADLAIDASGDVVVAGSRNSCCEYSFVVAKHRGNDGALAWESVLGQPNFSSQAAAVAVAPSGDVIATGHFQTWAARSTRTPSPGP